jgi:catechol 2,3-dioxygenase
MEERMVGLVQTSHNRPFFSPRRLGHVNIYISDFHRSLSFYRDVVGLGDGWTRPAIGGVFLNNGASHHDIGTIYFNSSDARMHVDKPTLNHLAFELEDQVELVDGYQRAVAAGTEFLATSNHLVSHSLYSQDPDGHGIEMYADTDTKFNSPDFLELRRASQDWSPGSIPPSHEKFYVSDHRPKKFENAIFHATKVTHAVLFVADLKKSADYYRNIVGLRPVLSDPNGKFLSLGGACGQRDVTLFQSDEKHAPDFHHMGFRVFGEDDLERSLQRAQSGGIALEAERDDDQRRSVVLRDPDGFLVQLYVDRELIAAGNFVDAGPEKALWLA